MTDFKNISLEFLSGSPAIIVLCLLALLVLTFYQYRRTIPPLARGPRALLISLRALALLALFFALLEPILSYGIEKDRKQRLSLILDISGSMNVESSGSSRSAAVERFLKSDIYSQIEETYDVKIFFVSESLLTNRPQNSELKNRTGFTALGDALAELSQIESGRAADVWALVSDGITNSGRPLGAITEKLSTPVVAIGVGNAREGLDVSVSDVDFNPVAYVGTETPIKIIVKSTLSGMENSAQATVSLSEDGRPVDSKQITLEPGERSQEVEMSYTPSRPGAHFLEAKIMAGALDVFKSDNSVTFAIKVLKSKIKILLVSDRIDWDYKFIKRALMSSERNEVVEASGATTGAARGTQFPNRQETLNQYDLIVLHNPNPEYKSNRFSLLESFLRDRGGGVFIFLGDQYMNSKSRDVIKKILPASMSNSAPMITLPAPSQLSPKEDNLLHPGLRIVDEVNQIRSAWAQSPPFTLIVPTTNIAEGVLILGETEYNYPTDNGAPIPILTARRFGPGKVICLSAAPVWRMGFQSTETQIAELRLMRFVDGCAQWLTALDDLAPVRISPEREVFSRGEKISFRATAYDQGYKPLKGVTGEIALINKDKTDTAFSALNEFADGRFRAVFEGVTPGTYTYQGQMRREGAFLKSETGTIEVTPYSLEERRLNPDFSALRELARETSGKYFHMSESAEIGEYFSGEKKSLNMAFDIPLRDNWRLLALFVIALGAEWILRKRYHLL